MEKFYTSLDAIPFELFGKKNSISPISLEIHQNLFLEIKNEIFNNLLDTKIGDELRVQMFSICNYVALDLYKIFKAVIEINLCKEKEIKIFNNKDTFPIFDSILNNEHLKQINNIEKRRNLFESAKFIKNRLDLILRGNKNYDLHNQSILLQEYINKDDIDYILLRPECWVGNESSNDLDLQIIQEVTHNIVQNLSSRYNIKKKTVDIINKNFISLFFQKFLKVNKIFKAFKKIDFEQLTGNYLLGGTPQPLGRILNYFYKKNKKKIIRFTHGGDRVFFDDILWIYNEIMFCDEYYVHGIEEKKVLQKKIKQNPHRKDLFQTKVITRGSEKHKQLFEYFRMKKKRNNKKILFVPGCFLGEVFMHNPYFKPSDTVIADYIFWTVKVINDLGYEITIKVHPGGIQFQRFFKSLPCEIIYNSFNLSSYDHSIIIFDFAGTAFFDSLASNKGIVYLNNHIRPSVDPNYNSLLQRCQVVHAFYDNNNIRFSSKDLKKSLEIAYDQQFCDEKFAKKYFFGPNS